MTVAGWGTGKGTVRILDPEIAPPTSPTFTFLGAGDTPGLSTTGMLDVGRSVNDDLLVKVSGKGSVKVKIELYGVTDEDQALWDIEENTDFTDEQAAQFEADSQAIFYPSPNGPKPGCSANEDGTVKLCVQDSPKKKLCVQDSPKNAKSSPRELKQPDADAICDDPLVGFQEGWVAENRYSACRNVDMAVFIRTGGIVERAFIVLQQTVYFQERSSEFRVASRFLFNKERSGYPGYVRFRVKAECSGELKCLNDLNRRFDLYEDQTSGLLFSDVKTKLPRVGLKEFIGGNYNLSVRASGQTGDFTKIRDDLYLPISRCDSVGYMRAGGRKDTVGCVLPEYHPTFSRVRLSDDPNSRFAKVQESAQHIYDAQQAGKPGEPETNNPLTRNRSDRVFRQNRRIARNQCREGERDRPSLHDCDEYAFASTNQGCSDRLCSARYIERSDNRATGGYLGAFLRWNRVLDEDEYCVNVTTNPKYLTGEC